MSVIQRRCAFVSVVMQLRCPNQRFADKRFNEEGSASVLFLALLLMLIPAAMIPISLIAASDARSRAVAAADLIALSGCENSSAINIYEETEVRECHDDGISVSVQTRTRLSLPKMLGISWFVHARAQAVHAL